jgi:GNAT superfamily N-acetyltransferase
VLIKRFEGHSWESIRSICELTGSNGNPVSSEKYGSFGKMWIDPYQAFCPEWTYVALDESRVVGYLTGCPDTPLFRQRQKTLKEAQPKNPEEWFGQEVQMNIESDYPAHLHVNLLPDYRGKGIGQHLIERFLHDINDKSVKGVHVFCGPDPVAFYKKAGFEELAVFNSRVFFLGRRIADKNL